MIFSPASTKQRMLAGAAAQLGARCWLVLARLLEAPLFLAFWGVELWGEWLLLTAVAEYVGLSQIGVTFAVYNEAVMAASRGDERGALESLHTAQGALLALAGAGVLVIAALTFTGLPAALGTNRIPADSAAFILLLAAAQAAIRLQIAVPHAALSAAGRYPLATLLSLAGMATAFLPILVLLPLGCGPDALASSLAAAALAEWLLFWLCARRFAPWAAFGVTLACFAEFRRLALPALKMFAFNAGQILNTQGYRIVVGLVLGPAALAYVNVVRTFCQALSQAGTLAGFTFQPELAAAHGRGETKRFRKLAGECFRISVWIGLVMLAGALLFGAWFIALWTNGQVIVSTSLLALPLLSTWLDVAWRNGMMPAYATNRAGRIGLAFVVFFGFGALAAAFAFSHLWGLAGALASLVVPQLLMTAVVLMIAPRLCGDTAAAWLRAAMQPPLERLPVLRRVASNFAARR